MLHAGVVLIRLDRLTLRRKAESVSLAFREYGARFEDNFCVIAPSVIRIRHEFD